MALCKGVLLLMFSVALFHIVNARDDAKMMFPSRSSATKKTFTVVDTIVSNAGDSIAYGDDAKDTTKSRRAWQVGDSLLNVALKLAPENLSALLLKGNAQYKLTKDWATATPYYENTLQIKPDYFEGNFNIGTILLEGGMADKAIRYLKTAQELKPEKLESSYNLADAYIKANMPDSALALYQYLMVKEPNKALPVYKVGATYGRFLNDLDNAVKYIKQAMEMDPSVDLYREDLGVAYGMKKQYSKLIKLYEDGIKINPTYAPYYFNLWVTYKQKGQMDKAKPYYKKASELDPQRYPAEP